MLLTCKDLSSLAACSQLADLMLCDCHLQQPKRSSNASPLSSVHSLRQLSLNYTRSSIAAGLTQLTGLRLGSRHETEAECVEHISGLTQLQTLRMGHTGSNTLSTETIASIATAHTQLTSLALDHSVCQPDFDVLLTHATQLTSFTCYSLLLGQDRSASLCSWKELIVTYGEFDAEVLTYIPTDNLTRLVFGYDLVIPSPSPTLAYRAWEIIPRDTWPDLMHRGLTQLTRCPAWQHCGSVAEVRLYSEWDDEVSPELLSLVLGALAPLTNRKVHLHMSMSGVAVGAAAVQALGAALGGSLGQLSLDRCDLEHDFWPAVWTHLPGVHTLAVGDEVDGAKDPYTMASFCSHATRPLQLTLGHGLFRDVGPGAHFERQCRVWGVPQVTVAAGDIR
jgi:hypothetical protein